MMIRWVNPSRRTASQSRLVLGESAGMRKLVTYLAVGLTASLASPNAFAIKEFSETWVKAYVDSSDKEDFKKLAGEAKCNVCHIDGENKKKHNPYGEALEDAGLLKKTFPPKRFKDEPDKVRKEVEEIFKKVEANKAEGADKTFGERIKSGMLPGGDVKGK
jgi:hypothetical protein